MTKLIRDDIDKFHEYGLYIPTRTIYMGNKTVRENRRENPV